MMTEYRPTYGRKGVTDVDVHTAALQRIHTIFDRYDRVAVSFSGGKDSTVCLNLVLEVAKERGRTPVDVFFFDEEAIPELTIDYVRRVAALPEVNFLWLAVPVKHRNACSRKEPYWTCWDPDARDRWVREMPEEAITDFPGFEPGMTVPEAAEALYSPKGGTLCKILGIRADESMRRRRVVSRLRTDNWLTDHTRGFQAKAYPIYDWSTRDVWVAPGKFGWDYNETYDVYEKEGVSLPGQRVCPPFGEEPLQKLHTYATCFPELWARMIDRVPGAATAARYAKTELYANGISESTQPPDGLTWREYLDVCLGYYDEETRAVIVDSLNKQIRLHNKKSRKVIHDFEADLISGISWRFLCTLVLRGDLKGRKAGSAIQEAEKRAKRLGISFEEALLTDGTGF